MPLKASTLVFDEKMPTNMKHSDKQLIIIPLFSFAS